MSGILLDTNVVSETFRPEPDTKVLAFLWTEPDLWLSVIVLHELEYGMRALPTGHRRDHIAVAIRSFAEHYTGRVLSLGRNEAESAARLRATARAAGRVLDLGDALIAATAATHGHALATRNTSDFQGLDLEVINPWK